MKKLIVLFIAVIGLNFSSWSQPDYTTMTFRSKVKEYKKVKPSLDGLDIDKEKINTIVALLGSSFYSENEIQDITEKVWLAFIDPKKFDYVYKDIAIRTLTKWNKKNVRGKIVVEPQPYLAEWTQSEGELHYFHKAFSAILSHYGLMAYSDDAVSTKKSLKKLHYTKKMNFKTAKSGDWTKSYLRSANNSLNQKGLEVLITNGYYDFFVCEVDKTKQLTKLFNQLDWEFINP